MSGALLRDAGVLEDETGLHLLTLAALLLQVIGAEYLTWSSEGLRAELEDKFGAIGVVTWERIQALRVLQAHDAYWKEWEVFEKVTVAIMGEPAVFSHVQPPEAEEVAISLETARRIDTHVFDEDVQGYVAAACLTDGLWYFEEPIKAVGQAALTQHDARLGIERDFGSVAAALQESDKFRDPAEDATSVQVNRVLEVRLALQRYTAAVERQLATLSDLVKRQK